MIEFVEVTTDLGRPLKDPGGEPLDQRKQLVCGKSLVHEVEEWAKRQPGRAPSFSEAVRLLVLLALEADREKRNGKR